MAESVKKKTTSPAKPRKAPAKKKMAEVTEMVPRSADPVTPSNHSVSHDEIARLAHQFWAERGHRHGHHEEDWYRAEQALRGRAS